MLADAQSSAHASCQELCKPSAFSRTVPMQKVNLALFPTLEQSKFSSTGATACLGTAMLLPLRRLFFAHTELCLHGDPSVHTNRKASSVNAHEHRMQSAAAPGNQTLIQTNLIHVGFARQLFPRQDIAGPVSRHLYVPLFSVTSTSCHVSVWLPFGQPHTARHHPG